MKLQGSVDNDPVDYFIEKHMELYSEPNNCFSLLEAIWDVELSTKETPCHYFTDFTPFDQAARQRRLKTFETKIVKLPALLSKNDPYKQSQLDFVALFCTASLWRLAVTSPFKEVSDLAKRHLPLFLALPCIKPEFRRNLLRSQISLDYDTFLQESVHLSPVSDFIVTSKFPRLDCDDELVVRLFTNQFSQHDRLNNFCRLLATHPAYLDAWLNTDSDLMQDGNPLPAANVCFLGLIAAASQHCPRLAFLKSQSFLITGGHPSWLNGLAAAPVRFSRMSDFNQILLYRPWSIDASHIENLVKAPSGESWSISEVVHAISVLAHFHGVAAIMHGCGVAVEPDDIDGLRRNSSSLDILNIKSNDVTQEENDNSIDQVINTMSKIEKLTGPEMDDDQKAKVFEKITNEEVGTRQNPGQRPASPTNLQFSPTKLDSSSLKACGKEEVQLSSPKSKLKLFGCQREMIFVDFASTSKRALASPSNSPDKTSQTPPTTPTKKKFIGGSRPFPNSKFEPLRLNEFNWQDHGFSIMSRFCDFSSLFDDKFRIAESLTYFTMGPRDEIDTTPFRVAIWNYIQLLYGIRHDDYDYRQLRFLFDEPLRKFVKAIACYPSKITKDLYDSCMKNFMESEKIHVTIMAAEAKIQAELLYALRAVNSYLK